MESTPTSQATPGNNADGEANASRFQQFRSFIGMLAMAMAAGLLIIVFVFRIYHVDGPSMETTLQHSERLIIWKTPRSWARITDNPYIPKRGDIIVFDHAPQDVQTPAVKKQLIKRVIGLPGERVTVRGGFVTVYTSSRPGGFNPDVEMDYGKNLATGHTTGNVDITMAQDQIFVIGDNRAESLDSRSFGPISADQIVGRLILRIAPIDRAKAF